MAWPEERDPGGRPFPPPNRMFTPLRESQGKIRLQTDGIIVGSPHPPASVPPARGLRHCAQVPG